MVLQVAEQAIKVTRDLNSRRLVKNPTMEARAVARDLNPREKPTINLQTVIRVWIGKKVSGVLCLIPIVPFLKRNGTIFLRERELIVFQIKEKD